MERRTKRGISPWTNGEFLRPPRSVDQVMTHCEGCCLGTAGGIQFAEDTGDMESYSARAYHELLGYFGIGLPIRDQGEYFVFSLCQTEFLGHSGSRLILSP